jgi:hypothetical protein
MARHCGLVCHQSLKKLSPSDATSSYETFTGDGFRGREEVSRGESLPQVLFRGLLVCAEKREDIITCSS